MDTTSCPTANPKAVPKPNSTEHSRKTQNTGANKLEPVTELEKPSLTRLPMRGDGLDLSDDEFGTLSQLYGLSAHDSDLARHLDSGNERLDRLFLTDEVPSNVKCYKACRKDIFSRV